MYNLTLADLHNYAVGDDGVLVHNSCRGHRALAKYLGGIGRSAQPTAQGVSKNGTKWWQYVDSNGKTKLIIEHTDGSVHVGFPKPQSPHLFPGSEPKYYSVPGVPSHIPWPPG